MQYIVLNNLVKGLRTVVHLGEINMAMHQHTLLHADFGLFKGSLSPGRFAYFQSSSP